MRLHNMMLATFVLAGTSGWAVPKPEVLLEVGETEKVARASEGDIIELKDGRLLLAYSEFPSNQSGKFPSSHDHASAVLAAQVSDDRGLTWSSPTTIVSPGKGDFNVMSLSFLRLLDGRLALFYCNKKSESDCRPVMRVSADEGKTWSAPRQCVDEAHRDYYVINNARVVRLSTGRILLPLCRHSVDEGDPQGCESEGRLCVVASDDDGASWRMICEPFKVFDRLRSRVTVQEPGIVELKDGRLLMWARTNRRAQWGMYSSDGGATWSPAKPLPLVSPNLANATITRLKDGNLVAVWNDYSRKPADLDRQLFAEHREPFSIAVSRDDGLTWTPSRTIEADPPGIRPDLYCCYFAVREIDDALYIFHIHHDGLKLSHLTKVPLAWVYATDEELREEPKLGERPSPFLKAVPVWPYGEGMVNKMNFSVRFKAAFDADGTSAVLRITGTSAYRIRLNGAFVGYGPVRSPRGFFRVDEWPLDKVLRRTGNALEIEAVGYNCNSYCHLDQPAFLQAEVVSGGKVLVATTGKGGDFTAESTERVRKVPRYSFQRAFAEAYRFVGKPAEPIEIERRAPVRYLDRIASYPTFTVNGNVRVLSRAKATYDPRAEVKGARFVDTDGRNFQFKAFDKDDLEVDLWGEMQKVRLSGRTPADVKSGEAVRLADGESAMLDVGLNDCGFAGMTVEVAKPGRLLFTFDEVLTDGEIDPTRLTCCNAVEWRFDAPGRYAVETFEPYVFRYANLISLGGELRVSGFHVRTFKSPDADRAVLRSSDPALERIFSAARETFVQNAVDIFTDCPSRERAGWLCDSFFIGRASALLTGDTKLERLFLQNFAVPDRYDHLPPGAVPMCWPADHFNGRFIPNWAMWFVLEVEEYLRRSGDGETAEALKPRLLALVDYLKTFRNSDGLLEKLPSWVFVEWSRSNDLVQDVSYPSNMTWADVLDAVGRLCYRKDLVDEAAQVRETVRRQSWTGRWFCDNAVRQPDGTLKLSGECTETCQYYAFFHRVATPESHPDLWRRLLEEFGPRRFDPADRSRVLVHPDVAPSNAFIGNFLRLMLLERFGMGQRILDETKDYFAYMADRTGTLWENDTPAASCCHGFASYVAALLAKSVVGVEVDLRTHNVFLRDTDATVPFCELELPLAGRTLKVTRRRAADGRIELSADVPDGWTVMRENAPVACGARILWERTIARDNYVGWPSVCRRANGELLAVYSGDRSDHVSPWGKVRLVRSSDGGETWSAPETIVDTVADDRDAGLIELKNGDLALFYFSSTFFGEYRKGVPYAKEFAALDKDAAAKACGYRCRLSHDGGKTWDDPMPTHAQAPHGGIQLKDGRLLMVGRVERFGNPSQRILAEESRDGGRSWQVLKVFDIPPDIDVNELHEPHVAEASDGTLVCLLRSHQGEWHSCQCESHDGGRTWTPLRNLPTDVFPVKCVPPHLLRLKDGRLVCVTGSRLAPAFGERAFWSADNGRTWEPKGGLALSTGVDDDLGYPSSVELGDGTILTVFYQSEGAAGSRPVLKAVKWTLMN